MIFEALVSGSDKGESHIADAQIMAKYCHQFSKNHPGSMIEEKNVSVALHYRNVPEIEKKAISIVNHLVRGSNLKLLKGKKVLELVPKNSNKGKAINFFMNKYLCF